MNDDHLIYSLDDTYIHMAIAKHGEFGDVRHYALSILFLVFPLPLWTLLLAAVYTLWGVSEWLPLAVKISLRSSGDLYNVQILVSGPA